MKAAVLFEGRNFYAGCKRWARDYSVDYVKLRDVIQQQIDATLVSLTYYIGHDDSGNCLPVESIERIHKSIAELQAAGYEVKTFPLRLRSTKCRRCSETGDEIVEKQVDTAIAVDAMLMLNKIDLFVLVTSDTDQLPLIRALRAAKKRVWIVSWKLEVLSPTVTTEVDDIIILNDHREKFLKAADPAKPAGPPLKKITKLSHVSSLFLDEITMAEKKFGDGYVGLHYFLRFWKSDNIPKSVAERSELLNNLIVSGYAEQYVAPDGNAAVRRAQP